MRQFLYGLALLFFLALPPVARLMESVMIIHMHMQMPLLVVAGYLLAHFWLNRFPRFFETWNSGGIPGILLFIIVISYWMIPRTMDEAISSVNTEMFKFISLPLLAGLPLRASWKRLSHMGKKAIIAGFTIAFFGLGWMYIQARGALCNNYLLVDQITLGWGFLFMGLFMGIYLIYDAATRENW